jgi:precorrin-6Y C5,15-methyltransferase (decarboxylating)
MIASRITYHDFRFGLKENEIIHSRAITKDEVRAVTIHKLSLPQKGVLWDMARVRFCISEAALYPEIKVLPLKR